MRWFDRLSEIARRLRMLCSRQEQFDRQMEEEMRLHRELRTRENQDAGLDAEESRYAAQRRFGNTLRLREEIHQAWGWRWIDNLGRDVKYGLRLLRRSPGFTSIAVLTLALGIGANTAIFTLIDAVMLRLLPVQKPEELVQLFRVNPSRGLTRVPSFTHALWEQVRDQQDIFSGVFSWSSTEFDLAQGGAVHYANGIFTSGSYFSTLGVQPAAGRLLSDADDQRGCPATAVLSYGFWQEHFGGAASAIGGTLSLNRQPFQIVGVSAPGFFGMEVGNKFDVAVPVCTAALFDGKASRLDHRSWWWLYIAGRIKPGITPEQVKVRLGVLSAPVFAGAVPPDWGEAGTRDFLRRQLVNSPAATGISDLRTEFGQPLLILMAVVGLVLLIASTNLASLMFARGASRNREIAVRKALGASAARLIRQFLTECLLLSFAGAAFGMLFARWGTVLLVQYISTVQNQVFLDLSPDWRVFGFTAFIAVLAGVLFGILPALRSTRVALTAAMKGAPSQGTEHRVRLHPGKWMVSGQIALSLLLLIVAGLFLRSLVKLVTLDAGFDRSNVLIVNANLKKANIKPEQHLAVYDEIESRLRSLPGVISVGRSSRIPITSAEWSQLVEVDTPNPPKGDDALVYFNYISPGYFKTLRIPLPEGRDFNEQDTRTSVPVAIVNETFARKFLPNIGPVGKSFKKSVGTTTPAVRFQIVGVARDSKYESLREDTFSQAFFPASQIPEGNDANYLEVRTGKRPSALISAVQSAIAGIDKGISLDFYSLAQQVEDSIVQERLLATLSIFFGALALLLAMIGLYGALSYLVAQRRSEFGIRMALGASRRSILALVMRDVAIIFCAGAAAGVILSLASVRVLQELLFGLTTHDPGTIFGAILVLTMVAVFAGYLPARRAMRLDPMVALRYE